MTHVDDGVLMAYMDEELSPSARADTAKHVLACPRCRERLDELAADGRLLQEALALVDRPAPVERAHARFRGRTAGHRWSPGRSVSGTAFIKAAGLVLLLAAGASAAVPGSPVRNWIRTTLVSREKPAAANRADTMSGVSILPANGHVEVAISRAAKGTRLRVRVVDGPRASVTVPEARKLPQFRTAPGRIDVVEPADEVLIDMPKTATEIEVTVNGDPYVVGGNGNLRAVVQAESLDGVLMFTLR